MASDRPQLPQHVHQAMEQDSAQFARFYLWLEKSMPKVFLHEVKREWISLIAHCLVIFKEQGFATTIHLKNAAISLCIDTPEADVHILEGYPLYGVKHYTTYVSKAPLPFTEVEGLLRVAVLHFTSAATGKGESAPGERKALQEALVAQHADWSPEKISSLLTQMDSRFLRLLPLPRQVLALTLFEQSLTRDHCQYEIERVEDWQKEGEPSLYMILAWKNVPKHHFLYRVARVVYRQGLVMRRVNATYINPYQTNSILMLAMGLHGAKGGAAWEESDLQDFLQEIVTVKYFGYADSIEKVFVTPKLLRGNLGNLLRTSVSFIHQILTHADPNLYTLDHIEEALCRHPDLTTKLCSAFEKKFHPTNHDIALFEKEREEYLQLVEQIDTGQEGHDTRRKQVLLQGMNFISHTLKTNFYKTNKTALAFRLDPAYLLTPSIENKTLISDLPYGIFFIKGMHYISFHIRFKDLSRGGLRTIYSKKKERMLVELNTVFTECYNLALTQHKKNKDIPEGGAKAVIFLKPYAHLSSEAEILNREMKSSALSPAEIEKHISQFIEEQEGEYLYQTQRSFIQNLLELVNCEPDGTLRARNILDYWKRPEYLYLGPDENMHNPMIEWIAEESKRVHYRPGSAFISGKPEIGINHKEFGVTSLGVNVYMHEVLLYLQIEPETTPFTVKMTGGPDGDVAGNQIVNLHRFYSKTAKLVALTDVSGTIYDPQGLDLEKCVQLFHQEKPIRCYPPESLHPDGFLLDKESKQENPPAGSETLCWRNTKGKLHADWLSSHEMHTLYRHNVHQVQADIFIPCGGRPRTLQASNYKEFFNKAGEPTARAIVEGANLYLSTEARQLLEQAGVLIVKDSSANKCGVICSSCEILCGLALSEEEFRTYKPQLVPEILHKLRTCALDEAQLLLKEHKETGTPLTQLSERVSLLINRFTDQLLTYLEGVTLSNDPNDPLIQCFLQECPKTLRDHFPERLLHSIPDNHKKAMIASHIASRLVYRKGLSWRPSLVDILPLILKDPHLY